MIDPAEARRKGAREGAAVAGGEGEGDRVAVGRSQGLHRRRDRKRTGGRASEYEVSQEQRCQ